MYINLQVLLVLYNWLFSLALIYKNAILETPLLQNPMLSMSRIKEGKIKYLQ